MNLECFECGTTIEAEDLAALGDALLDHARANHEWPFPDQGIRNFAEATQRLTGPADRLPSLGELSVAPVTEADLDDWVAFFERDAFVGTPEWAACFCLEPHMRPRGLPPEEARDPQHWTANRDAMVARLQAGQAFGYLARVDGRVAGWVNASKRSDYALYRLGDGAEPADADVIGVSCFIIAPPYRHHGLASALLDRVLADAAGRGVAWVEAYPFNDTHEGDARNFRGLRSMYDARGFEPVEQLAQHTVVRRPATLGRR